MSSIALIGPPGTGKSTLTYTMTKLGYTVAILDCDRKAKYAENLQHVKTKELIKKGQIKIFEPKSPLSQSDLTEKFRTPISGKDTKIPRSAISKNEPEGYIEIASIINEWEVKPPADVCALASFTSFQQHGKRLVLWVNSLAAFNYAQWDVWKTQLEEVVSTWNNIPCEHTILECHDLMEKDEVTGKIVYRPNVQGGYRDTFSRDFSNVFYTMIKDQKYQCLTKPISPYECPRVDWPLPVYVPSDFQEIFKIANLKGKEVKT